MKRFRFLAVLLCAMAACNAYARNPRGSASLYVIPSVVGLHVSGNTIVNSLGQPVPMRGVDKDGTEYMCLSPTGTNVFDGPADAGDITNLQSWAVIVVRLPVNESCWLGINGEPAASYSAATYRAAIVAYVNLLTAANIATVIDLQWVGPGTTPANPNNGGGLLSMPDNDHAPTFWTDVANTFKTNSSVIFDLYNEPYPDNNTNSTTAWTCLRDGGTSAFCSTKDNNNVAYTPVGTQSLINTIRATGATNIVMVPGVQFTNVLDQWVTFKPTDSAGNIAASWHSYATEICTTLTCWNSQIAPVVANSPLITGEIGENDCQGIYIDPLMAWLDGQSGGYLGWATNTYDCASFPALISDYPTYTPTGFGIDFRNHLLTLVGRTPPPPPVIPFFNNGVFPYGLAVGKTGNYTDGSGTVYFEDPYIQSGSGTFTVATGLAENMQFYQPFTTADTISGTADPTLYQTGRGGVFGQWFINVPNGTYDVTLGIAYNSTYSQTGTIPTDPYGQDQALQSSGVGTCVWSSFSGTSTYLDFQGGISGGSGYTNGTYTNVALTGGSGSGAHAQIVVAGGTVTQVITTTQGSGYTTGNTLSATIAGGSGFSAVVQGMTACPLSTVFVPAIDTAYTKTYTVSVFNQVLAIQSAASFGGGRQVLLNSIKVAIH